MDADAGSGDDDLDSGVGGDPLRRGYRDEYGFVRVHLERQCIALPLSVQHAHNGEENLIDLDERPQEAIRPRRAHFLRDLGADDAPVSVGIQVRNEPALLQRQLVHAREGSGDALDRAPPDLPAGEAERPAPRYPGRRLDDRRDLRRQLQGVRDADHGPSASIRLADDNDVGAERLELLAGLPLGDLAERDHRNDRGDADHDADQAQHRAQPCPAQAVGRLAGIGRKDLEGSRHRRTPASHPGRRRSVGPGLRLEEPAVANPRPPRALACHRRVVRDNQDRDAALRIQPPQ